MFEFLFTQSSAIARYRSAPLLEERIRYLAHCKQIGIKLETLRKIASHQLSLVCTLDLRDSDLNTIRAWLGHVSLDTTNIYAEIDLQMKAKAMALCDAGDPNPSRPWKEDKGVVAFLNSI